MADNFTLTLTDAEIIIIGTLLELFLESSNQFMQEEGIKTVIQTIVDRLPSFDEETGERIIV